MLWEISNQRPLDNARAEGLFSAGYDCDVVNACQKHLRGAKRHDSVEAITWLRTYEERCVPPAEGCHYLAMGLDPKAAGTIHAAGRTANDAHPYVRAFGDLIGFNSCGPVSLTFADNPDELVAWTLSDLDLPQAREYSRAGLSPEEATAWHPVATRLDISTDDLADIVRAGFSPDEVTLRHREYTEKGHSVGDAARTMLALRANPFA